MFSARDDRSLTRPPTAASDRTMHGLPDERHVQGDRDDRHRELQLNWHEVELNLDFDCIEDGSPEIRRKWREQSNAVIQPDGFKVCYFITVPLPQEKHQLM